MLPSSIRRTVLGAALCFLLSGSGSAHAADIRFRDVAAEWGLASIVGDSGGPPYSDLSYVNGCGVAVGDVDGDGRMDLYVVQGRGPNLLFLHRGDHFEEAGERYGVADLGRGAGAVFCDIDGDRFPELFVSNKGEDRLYRNLAGEHFELSEDFRDAGMGMGIGIADFDADGWVDVYVARYVIWPDEVPQAGGACQWKGHPVICGPEAYRPQQDLFYRGDRGGRLSPAPIASLSAGRGMGVMVFDADSDGRPDLYVANDATDNFHYVVGDTWSEDGLALGTALSISGKAEAGMGIAMGDINLDGLEDIVVTNFDGQTHSLYVSTGAWYQEEARVRGIGAHSLRRLSWGAQLFDVDNDGDLDLHVVNGHLYANADEIGDGTHWRQADDLFVNDGNGRFSALAEAWDGVEAESGRGSAVLDFDDDGLLDLVVWNLGGHLRLLHNETEGAGNALSFDVKTLDARPEGTLAGMHVELRVGQSTQRRWIRFGGGYLSGSSPRVHFGIGAATEFDSVRLSGDGTVKLHARGEN